MGVADALTSGASAGAAGGTGSYGLEYLGQIASGIATEAKKRQDEGKQSGGTASHIFGSVATSLATGNPLPAAIGIVSEIVGSAIEARNAFQSAKVQCVTIDGREYKPDGTPRLHNYMEISQKPDLEACIGIPNTACTMPFTEYQDKLEQIVRANGGTDARHYDRDGADVSKAKNTIEFARRWTAMSADDRLQYYRNAITPCLIEVNWKQLNPDQIIALEDVWGGRLLDGRWYWSNEIYEGHPASEWPRWIPDSSEDVLHRIYRDAWFDFNLTDKDLERIVSNGASPGVPNQAFVNLSPPLQRMAIANAIVAAAAASRAQPDLFDAAERDLTSVANSVALGEHGFGVRWPDVVAALKRHADALARERANAFGSRSLVWPIIGISVVAVGGVGVYLWIKRSRSRRR